MPAACRHSCEACTRTIHLGGDNLGLASRHLVPKTTRVGAARYAERTEWVTSVRGGRHGYARRDNSPYWSTENGLVLMVTVCTSLHNVKLGIDRGLFWNQEPRVYKNFVVLRARLTMAVLKRQEAYIIMSPHQY